MLSQLDWKSLSHHGKCTVPDDYDPCPNRNNPPNFPSTRTTPPSTTTFAEDPSPEIQTERPNLLQLSQTNTNEHSFLLPHKNKDVSKNVNFVIIVIVIVVVVIIIISVGIGCCRFFYQKTSTKKKQLDFSKSPESSRTDPLLDFFDPFQLGNPSNFGPRNTHLKTQNELDSDNFSTNLSKPLNPVPSSVLSRNSNDSNCPYDRLNFSSFPTPAHQNLSCRQEQQMAISRSSPETSTYVKTKPTSIQITLDIPGLPVFNPAQHNQLLEFTPAEQNPVSSKPGYLNAVESNK